MNNYHLEESINSLSIKIASSKPNGCGLIFIQGIASVFFLLPLVVTFFLTKEITIGGVISWLFAWLISGYFIKLYLWNKYGEEIFIIEKNELKVYNNYRFFKQNLRHYEFTKLNIVFFIGEDTFLAREEENERNKNQQSSIGFQLDKEIIVSHKELFISKIIEISKQVKAINYN